VGEDLHSIVRDPHFANPVYPFDDYSLRAGSPEIGFVAFDPDEAGRFPLSRLFAAWCFGDIYHDVLQPGDGLLVK
jgi:hypothetical protein